MLGVLLSILLGSIGSAAAPFVCENNYNRQRVMCLKEACPNTGTQEVDKESCQRSCRKIAEGEVRLVGGCSMYQAPGKEHEINHAMPVKQPVEAPVSSPQSRDQNQPSNSGISQSSQSGAQEKAASVATQGEQDLQTERASVSEVRDSGKSLQTESIKRNQQLLGRWEKELASGTSQNFPASRAKLENDRRLNQEAERRISQNKIFEKEIAEQAASPAIRSNLILSARGQQLESKAGTQLGNIVAALAQLASARQTTMNSGNALDSVAPSQNYSTNKAQQYSQKDFSARSESTSISPKQTVATPGELESVTGKPADSVTGPAAGSRLRASLRERLKDLLQKKASGKATPAELAELAQLNSDDVTHSFQGDLGTLELSSRPDEQDDPFLSSLSNDAFGMSGSETDATIRRLHRDLGSEDSFQMAGILPAESLSLFARVKAAHDSCAANSCVAGLERMAEN